MRNFIKDWNLFIKDYIEFYKQKGDDKIFLDGELTPYHKERNAESGIWNGHYPMMDLYVAQRIFQENPVNHLDIGSRLDGFVAHVAAFRELDVIDIRKNERKIRNINFLQHDITWDLYQSRIRTYKSISCLHVLEHIGLGRFGDKIDYWGHIKALDNIYKLLEPNGKLYLAVPLGKNEIVFNMQRYFTYEYIWGLLCNRYYINKFSVVTETGELLEKYFIPNFELGNRLFKENRWCGIFECTKMVK